MGQVNIRCFKTSDLKQVADIIAWSFKDKFQRLAPLPQNEMSDFLMKAGVIFSSPFSGYIVAEENNEILGVMVLKWLNQNRPPEEHHLVEASKYGWWKVIKLLFGLSILTRKTKTGECYIEHIAVKPEVQGKGVGTKLLEFGKELAHEKGFDDFTLSVSSLNSGAIKLYERLGFDIIRSERSYLTKRLFGIKEWHYMNQILTSPHSG